MLKFENTANIGDIIKAFDFKPMEGRPNMFMSGKVIEKGMIKHPIHGFDMYMGYTIEIVGQSENNGYKKGEIAYIPFEVDFMEYDDRVSLVASVADLELLKSSINEVSFH
jgi:hypothetical protein